MDGYSFQVERQILGLSHWSTSVGEGIVKQIYDTCSMTTREIA